MPDFSMLIKNMNNYGLDCIAVSLPGGITDQLFEVLNTIGQQADFNLKYNSKSCGGPDQNLMGQSWLTGHYVQKLP